MSGFVVHNSGFEFSVFISPNPASDYGHSSVDFSRHPSIQIQSLMGLRARGLIRVISYPTVETVGYKIGHAAGGFDE